MIGLPRRRRLRAFLQLTSTECGLCCCGMLLQHHGSVEPMWHLRAAFEVGRDGLSLDRMRAVLASRDMDVALYRADVAGLRTLPLPAVVHWERRHFVVLEALTDHWASIVDPAAGRSRLTAEAFRESYSGAVLTAVPNESFEPRRYAQPSPWRGFLAPVLRSRMSLLVIGLLSLLVYGVAVSLPLLTQWLVDRQIRGAGVPLGAASVALAGGLLLGYLGLLMLKLVRLVALVLVVGRDLMERTFGHLLRLPYSYFGARAPGELMFRLASVNAIRDLLSTQIVSGLLDAGILVTVFAVLFAKSPLIAFVALGFFFVIALLLVVSRRRVSDALDREMTEASRSQSLQLEAVVSIASVKVAGVEDEFFDRWRTTFRRSLQMMRARTLVQGSVDAAVNVIQTAGPVVILVLALGLVDAGRMTIGAAVAVQSLALTFFGFASTMFASYTQFLLANSYLDRLSDIVQVEPHDPVAGEVTAQLSGRISVEGVSFSYGGSAALVLKDVSFACAPGEKVAVVGASGSGKSTLGRLLVGLYSPTSGAVRFDGLPVQEYERRGFYRQIGLVPQEITLQNATIRENVTLGVDDVDDERFAEALQGSQLARDVEAMPMGADTLVAEMGLNLSGGQRQRVALARAIVKRPRVLVLDEATSSLDVLNESRISAYLSGLASTRVVIAHRMSTVVDADQVLVMDRGRIVERGTHRELVARRGHYYELFRTQIEAAPSWTPPALPHLAERAVARA